MTNHVAQRRQIFNNLGQRVKWLRDRDYIATQSMRLVDRDLRGRIVLSTGCATTASRLCDGMPIDA